MLCTKNIQSNSQKAVNTPHQSWGATSYRHWSYWGMSPPPKVLVGDDTPQCMWHLFYQWMLNYIDQVLWCVSLTRFVQVDKNEDNSRDNCTPTITSYYSICYVAFDGHLFCVLIDAINKSEYSSTSICCHNSYRIIKLTLLKNYEI